jgi:signal transduction histidine kinase
MNRPALSTLLVTALTMVLGLMLYVAAAGLGLEMALWQEWTPLIWPPAGIGVGLILLRGRWMLLVVGVGAVLTHRWQGMGISGALAIAAAYVAAGYTMWWLTDRQRRYGTPFHCSLESLRDVGLFVFAAVILASGIVAFVSALVIHPHVPGVSFGALWGARWLSDGLGVLVAAPIIMVWNSRTRIMWTNGHALEVLVWLMILIALGAMVFRHWAPTDTLRYPLELSMFPLMAWSAVRFGPRGVAAGILIVAIMAVWELRDLLGPNDVYQISQPPGYLWVFVGILAMTSLFLAAVMTELHQRERELMHSQERLHAILRALPNLVLIVDADGRCSQLYHAGGADATANAHGLPGRLLRETLPSLLGDQVVRHVQAAMASGNPQLFRYELDCLGETRYFEGHMARIDWDVRAESGVVWIAFDITASVHAQRDLELARDQAQRANRAKSEFLSVMSHEIRTPMNAILGFAELAEHTEDAAQRAEFLEIITRSGHDLLELINQMLDYSQLESGDSQLQDVPFSLDSVLLEVCSAYSVHARQKGLEFKFQPCDCSAWIFHGDPGRLRQVLTNLLSNAVKFTLQGHVGLRVEAVGMARGRAHLQIQVEDSGIGIPAGVQGDLFQPFQQIDSSSTRRFGGRGLGLGIVRRIVDQMGGTVRLTSEPGSGSVFLVSLELVCEPAA